jgi:hypothetical protein
MWGELSIGNNEPKPLKATPKVYVQNIPIKRLEYWNRKGLLPKLFFSRCFDYRGFSQTKILGGCL